MKQAFALFLVLLLTVGCASEPISTGFDEPPFFAFSRKVPSGAWEVQVDAMHPGNWSCKGPLRGRAADSFDLPPQTLDLTCVNGPTGGQANYVPRGQGLRFADFAFQLDNGLRGATVFK
ncbi:MAG: hypothetical protein AAFQ19_15445 [Pseudomonadota bacterium]